MLSTNQSHRGLKFLCNIFNFYLAVNFNAFNNIQGFCLKQTFDVILELMDVKKVQQGIDILNTDVKDDQIIKLLKWSQIF